MNSRWSPDRIVVLLVLAFSVLITILDFSER